MMTGEKFQKLCDIYLGSQIEDFLYNPNIGINNKNKLISDINKTFYNPKTIFCYSHSLKDLVNKLDYFNNPFILISGNSDENIANNDVYLQIAHHEKIILWYAQNLSIDHPKIKLLPIGIANSQWPHGNIQALTNIMQNMPAKTKQIYFNFKITTNDAKRSKCYNELCHFVPFLQPLGTIENWQMLATHKFCICPEGNGFDCHRIWECYYLKVVPIVLKTDFIEVLKKQYDLPLVILEDWNDLEHTKLTYENYRFDTVKSLFKSLTDNILHE